MPKKSEHLRAAREELRKAEEHLERSRALGKRFEEIERRKAVIREQSGRFLTQTHSPRK